MSVGIRPTHVELTEDGWLSKFELFRILKRENLWDKPLKESLRSEMLEVVRLKLNGGSFTYTLPSNFWFGKI